MPRSALRFHPRLRAPAGWRSRTIALASTRSLRARRHAAAILIVAVLVVLAFSVFPRSDSSQDAAVETAHVRSAEVLAEEFAAAARALGPDYSRVVLQLAPQFTGPEGVVSALLALANAEAGAETHSTQSTASVIAAAAGHPVGLAARLLPFVDWRREGGLPDEEVLLRSAIPIPRLQRIVTVTIAGETSTLRTDAERVGDLLDRLDVELGPHDRLSHGLDDAIKGGMDLVVVFVRKVLEEHSQYPQPVLRNRADHTLAPGEVRIVEGEPGEIRVFEEVTYENGVEIARAPHSAAIVKHAVNGERLRGPVARDGVSPVVVDDYDGPYVERLRVWATWYNATHGGKAPDHPAYGITYSGLYLKYGLCAVDPEFIPLFTRFYVPGYGECLAADTGGLINGWDVDLGFPEGHAPNPWHTGYVHIYILSYPD